MRKVKGVNWLAGLEQVLEEFEGENNIQGEYTIKHQHPFLK